MRELKQYLLCRDGIFHILDETVLVTEDPGSDEREDTTNKKKNEIKLGNQVRN